MVRILAALAFVGCSPAPEAPEAAPELGRVLEEGTPDATGVAKLLNDPATTLVVLDIDAKLDARAAKNLIAHRDGPDGRLGTADDDLFQTVAEIDAVSYVGDTALQQLLDYARAEGFVEQDEAFYGVVEGVELTKAEADAAVWAANNGTFEQLDHELDVRAAQALVDDRPFDTVEEVAAEPYVGKAAIEDLVAFGLADGPSGDLLGTDDAIELLEQRVDGLWFTSESDYRLVPWTLPVQGPVALADAKTVLAPVWTPRPGEVGLEQRAAEEVDLAWFFDRYTVEQEWWEDEQREAAAQWRSVREVFESDLSGAQVLRIGRTNSRGTILVGAIDVYLFGTSADGQLVGVWTVSVET